MNSEIIVITLQSKNVNGVAAVDLTDVLGNCQLGEVFKNAGLRVDPYLVQYLHSLGAKTAVIENNYVDHDYLDDYSNYYAKCFDAPPRLCARVHFFSEVYEDEELKRIVTSPNVEGGDSPEDVDKLQQHYLGFVVLRPLPRAMIGRTCLKPLLPGAGKSSKTVKVSFWGLGLHIDAMPFQEQDTATAACATCALWSASQVTAALFGHTAYSPSCITVMAGGHKTSEMRVFPNGGLSLTDMIYAVRSMMLDPIHVGVQIESDARQQDILLGNIYAYLGMGVPILLTGILNREDGSSYGDGGHAVVINGYECKDDFGDTKRSLISSGIYKLLVHDDQVGPYASIEFEQKDIPGNAVACPCKGKCVRAIDGSPKVMTRWRTEWNENGKPLYFSPLNLIIPVYNKIRVSYEDVRCYVIEIHDAFDVVIKSLQKEGRLPNKKDFVFQWSIRLRTCCDYKKSVRNDPDIWLQQDKLARLTMALPKYLWEIKVFVNGKINALFVVDATDSGCGMRVVDAYMYYRNMEEMWNWLLLTEGNSRKMVRNPIFAKLKEMAG